VGCQGRRTVTSSHTTTRWAALGVLCIAALLVVIDSTIVNVALPVIRADMRVPDTQLAWVVNAYMLSFGGFLLVSGRLGDLYSRRYLLIVGVALFTVASLACSLATAPLVLVTARFVQGLGGAVVVATALALIVELFPDLSERARAMSFYSFVAACGGGVGLVLGGVLTSSLDWRWIFLVNVPLGVTLCLAALWTVPRDGVRVRATRIPFGRALTLIMALGDLIYAVLRGNDLGWASMHIRGHLVFSLVLLMVFIVGEMRTSSPFIPLAAIRGANVVVANLVRVLWAAGAYGWFFIAGLYLQVVLGLGPMQVGLAFLPSNLVMAFFAAGLSAFAISRLGVKGSLTIGLLVVAAGYGWFVLGPTDTRISTHVLPGMLLVGLGGGLAFAPLLIAAVDRVAAEHAGIASGLTNTASMLGGALGLACIASLAEMRTDTLLAEGVSRSVALAGGYRLAFVAASLCTLAAALLSLVGIRRIVQRAPAASLPEVERHASS
jgi:EmrB/QacA subfamily drug resistance transporter